jgi:hypothetical protein
LPRTRTRAERLRKTEESDAWSEYLTTTRSLRPENYDEVEDWAWAKLQSRLRIARRAHEQPEFSR